MTLLRIKYRLAVLLMLMIMVASAATTFAKPPLQGPDDGSFDPLGDITSFEEEESVEIVGDRSRQLSAQSNLVDRLPIQGILTDAAGQPIANQNNLKVTFRLYDTVDATGQVCEYIDANVKTDARGFFNSFIEGCAVKLGADRVLDGQQVYLGIKVGDDAEMTPRRPLYPVPYAITLMPGASIRGEIDTLEGTFYVTNNAASTSRKLRGAIQGVSTSGSNFGYGVYGSTVGARTFGVYGRSDGTDGIGVYGLAPRETRFSGDDNEKLEIRGGRGVYGLSQSVSNGIGVNGIAATETGVNWGVFGRTQSDVGYGTYGLADSRTGVNYGVYGHSRSTDGYGVYGIVTNTVGTNYGVYGQSNGDSGYGVYGFASSINRTVTYGVYGQAASNKGYGVYGTAVLTGVTGVVTSPVGSTYGVHGVSYSNSGHGVYGQNLSSGVGVMARSAAGNPLEAYGSSPNAPVFRVENEGDVYALGSYHCGGAITETVTVIPPVSGTVTTARSSGTTVITTINRSGLAPCLQDRNEADFAEMLPAAERALEAGDVLAINEMGELVRTENAYQSTVVGVYSTKPSYLGNSQMLSHDGYAPLALVGIVPVKVTSENGAIHPGDLLVASSTSGHAMRADTDAPNGTVIGKALAGLSDDTGMIRMLVMLQ